MDKGPNPIVEKARQLGINPNLLIYQILQDYPEDERKKIIDKLIKLEEMEENNGCKDC